VSNHQVVVQNEVVYQIWLKLRNCWAECLFAIQWWSLETWYRSRDASRDFA